jgi:hypothetical protein
MDVGLRESNRSFAAISAAPENAEATNGEWKAAAKETESSTSFSFSTRMRRFI